jgi:hypothetical protein
MMRTLINLLALIMLVSCTREELSTLPQPQSGYQSPIDLRNDGYFERLGS